MVSMSLKIEIYLLKTWKTISKILLWSPGSQITGLGGFLFCFLATPCGRQDLSSQLGIEPKPPAVEVGSLNHWTAREVTPGSEIDDFFFFAFLPTHKFITFLQ